MDVIYIIMVCFLKSYKNTVKVQFSKTFPNKELSFSKYEFKFMNMKNKTQDQNKHAEPEVVKGAVSPTNTTILANDLDASQEGDNNVAQEKAMDNKTNYPDPAQSKDKHMDEL